MHYHIKKIAFLFSAFMLLFLWSCTSTDSQGDQYLKFNLSASLKEYNRVQIRLVNAIDSNTVYDTVWNDTLKDPVNFPRYKLKAAKNKDFVIQIRGYNKDKLSLARDIKVIGNAPQTPITVQADLRLYDLELSQGSLQPALDPDVYAYTVNVPDTVANISFTLSALDSSNILQIGPIPFNWGKSYAQAIKIGENTLIITVQSKDGKTSKIYTIVINRGNPPPPSSKPISVQFVSGSPLNLTIGGPAITAVATVNPTDADQTIIWTSLDTTLAKINAQGLLQPIKAGNTFIKASAKGDTSVNALLTLNVSSPIPSKPTKVQLLIASPLNLYVGGAGTTATASVTPADADQSILWASLDSTIAKVNAQGLVTPIKAGTTFIKASAKADSSVSILLAINVASTPPPKPTKLQWVTPSPLSLTLGGAALTGAATITPATADQTILWMSLDTTIVTVNAQGLIQAVKVGTTFVKASAKGDTTVNALLTVNVVNPPPIKPTSVQMITNPELDLADNGTLGKADAKVLPTGALQSLIWTVTDSSIVKVDSLGNVSPLKVGTTTLKARAKADTSLSATLLVKVMHIVKSVDSLRVTPKTKTFYTGSNLVDTVKVTFYPIDTGRVAEFKSSDVGVVTVNAKGELISVAPGKATILVNPLGDKTKFDSCVVTVIKDTPKLDPGADKNVQANQPITFNITVTQAFGTIAILRWDLNGDGVWEDSTKNATAAPVFTYPLAKSYTAKFEVRDSEGNDTVVTRQVITDAQIPQIKITHPAADTLINTKSFIVGYDSNSVKKTKPFTLVEGLNKIVITANNAGKIGGDSLFITVDDILPATPVLSAATPVQNPSWTWPAVEAKAKYAIRLVQGTQKAQQTLNSAGYTPPVTATLVDGSYTLYVMTIDSAGNTSNEVLSTVMVDKTKPQLAITGPSADSLVTSINPIIKGTTSDNIKVSKLTYSNSQGGLTGNIVPSGSTWSLSGINFPDGKNTLTIHAEDAAGNQAVDQTIDIYKWSKVIFVRSGKNGNGTSWANAYGIIDTALMSARAKLAGAQVWVSKGIYGEYGTSQVVVSLPKDGLVLGGFLDAGAPSDSSQRAPVTNPTTFFNRYMYVDTLGTRYEFNGIDFWASSSRAYYTDQSGTLAFLNCTFRDGTNDVITMDTPYYINVDIINCNFFRANQALYIRNTAGNVRCINAKFYSNNNNSIKIGEVTANSILIDKSTLDYDVSNSGGIIQLTFFAHISGIISNSFVRGGRLAIDAIPLADYISNTQ